MLGNKGVVVLLGSSVSFSSVLQFLATWSMCTHGPVMQGSTELPSPVLQWNISSCLRDFPPWCMTCLWQLFTSTFQEGRVIPLFLERRMDTGYLHKSHTWDLGTNCSRTYLVILVWHVSGFMTTVWCHCAADHWTRWMLNTDYLVLVAWIFYLLKL